MRRLCAVALLVGAVVLVPGTAQAQAADAQGWWSSANRAALPAAPAPPDVGADDLLVQGGDPGRVVPGTGVGDDSPAPTAVAALRFQVGPGAQVGPLVLQLAGSARATDLRAYPTSSAWTPAQDGAMEDAPTPNLTRYSEGIASADGATLVFADIGRLVDEQGLLSIVLVAGPTDRAVIHHPLPTALAVQPAPVPDVPPAPPEEVPPPVVAAPVLAVAPAVAVVAPAAAPVPAVPPAPVVVAPPTSTTPQAARVLAGDPSHDRVVVGLEALLVLTLFGLLGQGPLSALARVSGQPAVQVAERGVGRFARAREGRPPRL